MYQIEIKAFVKTTDGKEFTHSEMLRIIDRALWDCEEFRDVEIFDYKGDTLNNDSQLNLIKELHMYLRSDQP